MTTYVLEPQHSVQLPPGALAITLVALNGVAVRLRVIGGGQILAPDQPGRVVSGILQPAADRLIVTRLSGPILIEALSPDGQALPVGTLISVTIGAESVLHANGASAVIRNLDVSGVISAGILELAPGQGQISVRAVFDGGGPTEGRLAAAIAAVREYLERTPQHRLMGLRLAVVLDRSASMRPWYAVGAPAAVVDVLAGIAQVCGDGQLRIWDGRGWRAVPAREAAGVVTGLTDGQPFSSSRLSAEQPAGQIEVWVTDEPGPARVLSVVLCLGSAAAQLQAPHTVLAAAAEPAALVTDLASPPGGLNRLVGLLLGELAAWQGTAR